MDNQGAIDWQPIAGFEIARTETTVAQFRRFVLAARLVTHAERIGGGSVYEAGWVQKPGWHWAAPYGTARKVGPAGAAALDDEPATHVTFDEARAFCRWAGGRLPNDEEWASAAYTESRPAPALGFERGRTYRYPVGESPNGAQCLDDCGEEARTRAVAAGTKLWRGHGHALAGATPAGVNGLHEMGGNVWEWVDAPVATERRTRGGSWWYGAEPMRAEHVASKPALTAVIYIGFRCAR